MKKLLLLLFAFCIVTQAVQAQNKTNEQGEHMPEFPGGQEAMYRYIDDHLQYPELAVKYNKEGKVKIKFVIMEDGSVSNVEVVKPFGYGFDEEAVRVVKEMPKWKPAISDGKPVKIYFTIPISFTTDKNNPKQGR